MKRTFTKAKLAENSFHKRLPPRINKEIRRSRQSHLCPAVGPAPIMLHLCEISFFKMVFYFECFHDL